MVRSLLLLVNFINDMCHRQGKMNECIEFIEKNGTINHANEAILWCRRHGIPIVHMHLGFHENYIDLPIHSPLFKSVKEKNALKIGSFGTKLHEEILFDPSDTLLVKHRTSVFYGTELTQILSSHSINTLIIGGISTPHDIEMAAREAHDRDYYTLVLQDTCAAKTDAAHLLALESISHYGKVRTIHDLSSSSR